MENQRKRVYCHYNLDPEWSDYICTYPKRQDRKENGDSSRFGKGKA